MRGGTTETQMHVKGKMSGKRLGSRTLLAKEQCTSKSILNL